MLALGTAAIVSQPGWPAPFSLNRQKPHGIIGSRLLRGKVLSVREEVDLSRQLWAEKHSWPRQHMAGDTGVCHEPPALGRQAKPGVGTMERVRE